MPSEEIDLIDFKNLGRFGIGTKSNGLYFDGQRVHTDAVIGLTRFQKLIALSVSVASILSALATVAYSGAYVYDTFFRAKPVPSHQLDIVNPPKIIVPALTARP